MTTDSSQTTYAHQSPDRALAALDKIHHMTLAELKHVLGSIVTCELVTLEQMDLAFGTLCQLGNQ